MELRLSCSNPLKCVLHVDGLVQERRNSIANTLELRLSCTNPLKCVLHVDGLVQERRNTIANALELRLSCTNPLKCVLHVVIGRCLYFVYNRQIGTWQVYANKQENCTVSNWYNIHWQHMTWVQITESCVSVLGNVRGSGWFFVIVCFDSDMSQHWSQ